MPNEFIAKRGVITPVVTSTVTTGTAPFAVSSTTAVTNLNADLLDGNHASAFATVGQTMFIGNTGVAINRASAALSIAGINTITGEAGAAASLTLQASSGANPGNPGNNLLLRGGGGNVASGGTIEVRGGASPSATGGGATVAGGDTGGSSGGSVSIFGGSAQTTASGIGGNVTVRGGDSDSSSTSATGGNVFIRGGVATNSGVITKTGGSVYIDGGQPNTGGTITTGAVFIGNQANSYPTGTTHVTLGKSGTEVRLPGVGTSGLVRLGTNGTLSADTATYARPDVQTFTNNGTWTKPSGVTFVFVRILGGGGGGGGGGVGTALAAGAGGGGGSGCMEYLFLASALPSTVSVTIGAGGTGGGSGANGGDGTGSTFGIYLRSGRGLGGTSAGTGGVSGSMAVQSSAGATTMAQLCTMMYSTGAHGIGGSGTTAPFSRSSNSARDCYNAAAGGGAGGQDATNFVGGYGGAGFWILLNTSADLISPLATSVRSANTPMGNGPAPGAALGNNGASATRIGDGGAGGNYGTTTGGNGGAGFRGGGGGGGGGGGTTGGTGGTGGAGYCEVYSW